MSDGSCDLCGLPAPDPPVTDPDLDGEFCCRGCLEVTRALGEDGTGGSTGRPADRSPEAARETLDTGPEASDPAVTAAVESGDAEETFLSVAGMHCTTCEAFLESRASARDGVLAAEASYPSEAVKVTYDPEATDPDALASALSGAGYRARPVDEDGDRDDDRTVGRLLVGGFFGMMTMAYYLVGLYPAYLGLPSDRLLVDLSSTAGLFVVANVWVMATVVLVYTGYPILRGAVVSLRARRPNMDLLVALAAVTAYVYSTAGMALGRVELYFDVSVVVVMAVSVGNYYEERIRRTAAGRLRDLTEERVDEARLRTDEGTREVSVAELSAGDEVLVRPGERVPVDGTVIEGSAAVDESLVTGESVPVTRGPGEEVVGGSLATDGALLVEVGEGATSTVDRLVEHLWEVRTARPGTQRLADRLATVFVPLVLVLAAAAGVAHLALGAAPADALLTALAVLVVSCPCALGLATPLAVASGVRAALERGIVVTDAAVFETATDADVVAFDKTGTLTAGRMSLRAVHADPTGRPATDGGRGVGDGVGAASDAAGRDRVLSRAAAVEAYSDHPLGAAVVSAARQRDLDPTEASAFERHPGRGVSADVGEDRVVVGRRDLVAERGWTVPERLADRYESAREAGDVPALVAWDGRARGVLVASDPPREDWRAVLSSVAEDRRVVVITGDRGAVADRFRDHPGVERVFDGVPPEAKAEVVSRLRREGTVAMVGDGSNDAPALAAADLGIALESGTRLAADAADAVVTTDDLATVPEVFEVTARAKRRVRENLAWAFCYNLVAVPAAALGLISPLVAAVAMAASSLLVVSNSARSIAGEVGDD